MHLILASQSLGRKKLLTLLNIPFRIIPSTLDEDKIIGKTPLETINLRAKLKGEEVVKQITNNKQQITDYFILSADSGVIIDNQLIGKPKDYEDAVRILKILSGKTHEFVTAVYFIKLSLDLKEGDAREGIPDIASLALSPTKWSNFEAKSGKLERQDPQIKIWQIFDRSLVTFKKLSHTTIKQYLTQADYKRYAGGYALFDHPDLIKPTLSDLLSNKSYKEILKPINPQLHPDHLESLDLIANITGSISNVIGLPLEKVIPRLKSYDLL